MAEVTNLRSVKLLFFYFLYEVREKFKVVVNRLNVFMMFILLYFRMAAASDFCSKAVYFDQNLWRYISMSLGKSLGKYADNRCLDKT
jgi:hypothetical protein